MSFQMEEAFIQPFQGWRFVSFLIRGLHPRPFIFKSFRLGCFKIHATCLSYQIERDFYSTLSGLGIHFILQSVDCIHGHWYSSLSDLHLILKGSNINGPGCNPGLN